MSTADSIGTVALDLYLSQDRLGPVENKESSNRRAELLFHSRDLLRKRGFNAFSHRELASHVGVKSSSVHYYFPSKQDIGLALIQEYRVEVMNLLQSLEPLQPHKRLERFIGLFDQSAGTGEDWCIAGMLASDFMTLSEELQAEVRDFFAAVEKWLAVQARLLNPTLKSHASQALAKSAMAILEGALLLARSQGEPQRVKQAGEILKVLFQPPTTLTGT